ncbi:MFS transporter [Streptomyces sp. NBC_00024]|uniref:MFS transporter n=1 Tax=Streptomyces sp. NBC_00024 TaxID=2903612 RepID=UPI003254E793
MNVSRLYPAWLTTASRSAAAAQVRGPDQRAACAGRASSAVPGRLDADAGPASPGAGRRRWVLAIVSMAWFLVLIDDTAVAIALPPLGRELGLGLAGLEWVVNLYTLTFAVLTLVGGMLADRYGSRPVFLVGLVAFTGFSLAAGLAPNGAALVGLRAGQGAGAALMGPAALALLLSAFTGTARALALGVWSGVGAAALAGGPLLGAVLTVGFGWRWIFLVNVPLGAVVWGVARRTLPSPPPAPRRGPVDVAGALTSAAGLSALIFAFTRANEYGWTSLRLWAMLAAAVAAFAAFAWIERRAAAPLLDLSLFRRPNFLAGNLLGMVSLAVMCSVFFFLSLYLQLATGSTPIQAGLALLPLTLLGAAAAPAAGWLVPRLGARTLIATGLVLTAAGLVLLTGLAPDWGAARLQPGLLTAGLGLGLATAPITTATLGHIPDDRTGIASAALNAFRMIGLSLGIAVMGAITAAHWPGDLARTRPGPAFASGIGHGFWINAVIALAGAALAIAAIRTPHRPRAAAPRKGPAADGATPGAPPCDCAWRAPAPHLLTRPLTRDHRERGR